MERTGFIVFGTHDPVTSFPTCIECRRGSHVPVGTKVVIIAPFEESEESEWRNITGWTRAEFNSKGLPVLYRYKAIAE